jgi:hypothetical protein
MDSPHVHDKRAKISTEFARNLRRNAADAEKALWRLLRASQVIIYKLFLLSTLAIGYALFMTIAPEPPTAPQPDQPDSCPHCVLGHRVERRLAMLDQLAELAMAAAVVAQRKILEQDERDRAAGPDPTGARAEIAKHLQLDFARAAQAVRQTLALQEKIEQDFRTLIDRQAAEAAARRAEAAQRRAAERQANIARRKARIRQELGRVIETKAAPGNVNELIANLNIRLRPERLDSDFGDIPLREIFLRICRNLGVPEEWVRQWDEGSEPEGSAPGAAPAPMPAPKPTETAEPAKSSEPAKTAGPSEAKASPQRRQNAPPPWAVPGNLSATPAATALALCLAAPGTGPPLRRR